MPSESFVHLHTHTEYSLLDGAARIDELVTTAAKFGQPAIAITDHGVLYGAVEFYKAARAANINPIVGSEVYMAPRSRHQKEGRADADPSHLVLLARNNEGYGNLIKLVSRAHLEGYYYKPRIDKELLAEHADGLIGLSACLGGELPQAILSGNLDTAEAVAREHMEILGPDNYFLELQDHAIPEEVQVREGLTEIARRTGLPLIGTNDSHYINPEDAEAHDILLCLQTGARRAAEKRFKFAGPHFYLASTEEMQTRFANYGEAVSNTVALAERCKLEMQLGHSLPPKYSPIPEGMDANSYLRHLCERGLQDRYGENPSKEARHRLEEELDVIAVVGMASYFLIVWDAIRAGRCEGVKVGPGRGSAAGSIVSYVLRITNICPLRYGLIFGRFLNVERVQMPDFDIDFDDKRRDRVLHYVQEKYGKDHVAQIITFGTMAARAAIRDVGRVLEVPLPDVDRLAKLIPFGVGITLERALKEARELRELYENEEWVRLIIDNAKRLEGICRNASTHAAGVVIAPEPLTNILPIQRSTNDKEAIITQFDMNGVQEIGLLKIDFLGLSNLTIIDETVQTIKKLHGVELDIDEVPLDDPATFALLSRGDTYGIFQMEQAGGKRILMDMQPSCLEDLGVATALNRPGPIEGGVIDLYMKRKRGEEPVTYLLPELEPFLSESYGVIVYQDQVMQIAAAVAGYTLGEADLLRAAMGKKDKPKMTKQREKFIAGAGDRGVSAEKAMELFDLMAFFAGYGFGKAHSMAYGLISYQTAYLKANYPLEYMTALLNSKAGDFDRLKQAILDSQSRGLVISPPDVNRSQAGFAVGNLSQKEILYGLHHIKNVGEKVVEQILQARQEGGPFASLFDICSRVNTREVNRRVLEALIRSGACDCIGDRSVLLALVDRSLDRAAQIRREKESGQTALFADTADHFPSQKAEVSDDLDVLVEQSRETLEERLGWERELLGIYLSDHPLRQVEVQMREKVDTTIAEMGPHLDGLFVQVGGAVRGLRTFVPRRSSTGQRMAFLQLEDTSGICEVVIFARIFEQCAELLRPDAIVIVKGKVESQTQPYDVGVESEDEIRENATTKVIAQEVYAFDDVRLLNWRKQGVLQLIVGQDKIALLPAVKKLLENHSGDIVVRLRIESSDKVDEISLATNFNVEPSPALELAMTAILGPDNYRIDVRRQRAPETSTRGNSRSRTAATPV